MVDVVETNPIIWVINIVESSPQYVSETTTAIISEETKTYQIIDSTASATNVIEIPSTQVVQQTVESVVEVVQPSGSTNVIESSPVIVYTEEKMPYTSKVDTVSDTLIYRGEANPGSATNIASWRIQQITFTDSGNDVDIKWADGEASFTKIWDDRASYTYS